MPTAIERAFLTFIDEGFKVYSGYNSYHFNNFRDAPFTYLVDAKTRVVCSQGIAIQEFFILETLFAQFHPKSILIIGNAFGWSAVIMSILNPEAKVTTIDPDSVGNAITERIANKNNYAITVREGYSPQDVKKICAEEFESPVECVFIDAVHDDEHQYDDFCATVQVASPNCLFLFHDVVNWSMQKSFQQIIDKSGLVGRILQRTTSGIGMVCSQELFEKLRFVISCFADDDISEAEHLFGRKYQIALRDRPQITQPLHAIKTFIRRLIPNAIFKYIKPLISRDR